MIGFSVPWALLGLLAAGIPLLLHLFARREPPTVVFPATRYLEETARAHHRRLTLQHWLLLLVRTLLIATLVLAAAGPTLPGGRPGAHAPVALGLVLDNSLSSAAVAGGTPVFEGLRAAAREILGSATDADGLWLVTADGVARRGSRAELLGVVERLEPLPRRLDLGTAIGMAREAVAGDPRPGRIVAVTDLQASALSPAPGSGPLVVLGPGGEPVPNLGVAALDPGRLPWGPDGGRVAARLTGSAGRSAALTLTVPGRPARQQLGTAGETASLPSGPLRPGWWPVQVTLEPDELRLDDERQTAVRVAPAARASWRPEDRFVATACEVLVQNGRLVRGGEVSIGELGPGASIVQPPADPAALGALNRALAARGATWRFGALAAGSGVTDSTAGLGRQQVARRYTLVPAPGSPGQGVLAGVGGAPWAVRSGGVILLGSRLEPEWTALPLSAEFVPFIDFLANRAVRGEVAVLDAAPGDLVPLPDAVTAVSSGGRSVPVEGGSRYRVPGPGLQFLLAGRDTIGVLAVNADPRESDLTRSSAAAAGRLWPGARVGRLDRAVSLAWAAGGRTDLRGAFLLAAAVLALADALLAGSPRRRRTAG